MEENFNLNFGIFCCCFALAIDDKLEPLKEHQRRTSKTLRELLSTSRKMQRALDESAESVFGLSPSSYAVTPKKFPDVASFDPDQPSTPSQKQRAERRKNIGKVEVFV